MTGSSKTAPFTSPDAVDDIEEGSIFAPKFNADGLIAAVACDAVNGEVLMLAWMNELALQKTIETGEAHYWSRSRGKLWHKGETSGEVQQVTAILTDCDQDAVILKVHQAGRGAACHTGRRSCFYRQVVSDGSLKPLGEEQLFDPEAVYSSPEPSSEE